MTMGKQAFAATLLAASAAAYAAATPVIITFDDLDASAGDLPLDGLGTYGGLTWANTLAYGVVPGFDGFNNGIVSSTNAAYSGGELAGPVVGSAKRLGTFDFESAYLGAGYYDNLTVTFTGLRSGVALFTQSVTVNTASASLFNFGFTDIDTLLFQASTTGATADPFSCGNFNCTQFTMDDVSVVLKDVEPPTNGLPEPATLALFAVAAAGMVASRRRA